MDVKDKVPPSKFQPKSELTSQNDIAERTTYFMDFNAHYQKMQEVGPWNFFKIDEFTERKLKDMIKVLPALPPMNMKISTEGLVS